LSALCLLIPSSMGRDSGRWWAVLATLTNWSLCGVQVGVECGCLLQQCHSLLNACVSATFAVAVNDEEVMCGSV
jgi:hypothetical protein